jgi:hypothetical protein
MHGLSITCGVPVPDNDNTAPDLLPVLSRGRHRNASKGACFMELASFLAGERWSDHPSCTHPLLAELARSVNDYTTDAARPKLATLIPSVIGLTSSEPKIDVVLALRAATVGLPIVSAERQGVLAVGLLACERVMCDFDDPRLMPLREQGLEALDRVPQAVKWARRFNRDTGVSQRDFRRRAAPRIVNCSVQGIAKACISDPDAMLRSLLETAIEDVRSITAAPVDFALKPDPLAWPVALTRAQ